MKNALLVTLLLMTFTNLKSQDTTSIEAKYASYFDLPRESLFLHLNKSTFIKGESLWLKGYVYNRKEGVPFEETTNIYVGLYDKDGKQVSKHLLKAAKGYASASIKIDSTYASGTYYLKAATNWMRNFNEDDAFVQEIQIINENKVPEQQTALTYDLQVLPEGGHLVHDVPGVVGVKITDNKGLGVPFEKGVLVNESGKNITDFKSNSFGMASFSFTPNMASTYHVFVTLKNGEKVKAPIPSIKEKGIALKVNNTPGAANVIVSIATNKVTFKEIKRKPYYLLIHKDGEFKSSPFVFNKSEKEIILPLTGDFLFDGINTITLFDENKNPIAERLIFNDHNWKPAKTVVNVNEKLGDSISLKLNVFSQQNTPKNLSISVLPAETRAYNQKLNIYSEFLLKPYVKGYIENPAYYFKEANRRKEYDLDLLLLTQGWSRYEWSDIFNRTPNPVFEFEKGLTLQGNISQLQTDKFPAVFIEASKYHKERVVELDSKSFTIPEIYFETDEKVGIQLVKRNGKLKYSPLYVRTVANLSNDNLNAEHFTTPKLYVDPLPELEYGLEDEKITLLDEIEVVGKSKEKEKRYNNFVYGKNDVTVDLETANKLPFVTDIIRRKGFDVNDDTPGVVKIFSRRRSSLNNQQPPILYFDGTRLVDDFDFLYQLRSTEIERIVVEPVGVSEGSRGAGGVIRIWSRKGSLFENVEKKKPSAYVDNRIGYVPVKKYYAPKYIYSSSLFRYFGVVHWENNLITDNKGKALFNIPDRGLREVNIYIEGMTESGELISTVQTLRLNKAKTK
jgi:hypothetical protein